MGLLTWTHFVSIREFSRESMQDSWYIHKDHIIWSSIHPYVSRIWSLQATLSWIYCFAKPIDRIREISRTRPTFTDILHYILRLVIVFFASNLTIIIRVCCTRQSRAPDIDRCAPNIWPWPATFDLENKQTDNLTGIRFKQESVNGQTDGQTDGRTLPITLSPSLRGR